MDPLLYSLNQAPLPPVTSVGYKAFHLNQLLQKGYPVLPGFVVTAGALWSFLHSITWDHPLFADFPSSALRVDIDNPTQLRAIATQLRYSITTSPLPDSLLQELEAMMAELPAAGLMLRPSLIVNGISQSSAEHPWLSTSSSGGLFNAEICVAQLPALAKALQAVWADFFSAKSLFYWQRLEIPLQHVRLAVLVQSMQDAIAAGTVVTTPSQFQIQATPGLGMAIDRGEVAPDTYQIQPQTGAVQVKHLGWKAIAYHLADLLAEPTAPLTACFLSDEQQRYTLESFDLAQLVDLVQQVVADFGANLSLGWLLHQQANGGHQLYLTHILPTADKSGPGARGQKRHSPQRVTSPTVRQTPYKRTANQQVLIGSGAAASGGQVFARATVMTSDQMPTDIPPHTVLVAPTIPLDWLPWIETAAALVTEQGSMTSHCAILARELRVPAVLGVPNVTRQIQSGELLWVDGDRGRLYRMTKPSGNPLSPAIPTPSETPGHREPAAPLEHRSQPQITARSPRHTQLMVNLSQPTHLEQMATLPVDGVGLLRSELLALSVLDAQSPHRWLQHHSQQEFVERMAAAIQQFGQAFYPRPVFYRSLDLRPHELQGAADQVLNSDVSVLGLRGTFSYQLSPKLFQLELAAIAQVQKAGYDNLRLILPFVRAVEEFTSCRQYVEQAGLMQVPDFQLWIMAEVPAVLLLLPDFVDAGVQGISIGTNDLTQLLLGVHRDQPELASVFNERHPALKRAIAHLIQQSRQLGIPCSICGEAPSRNPNLIQDLVEWGIDAISVAPEAVDRTQAAIVQAEVLFKGRTITADKEF